MPRYIDDDEPSRLDVFYQNDAEPETLVFPLHVTVTLDDRAYGGPEEGGWWYDTSHVIEHHYCQHRAIYDRVMVRMADQYDNRGRYPISSVCSDGEYRIHVGQRIPENYPTYRPRYE